MREYSPTLDELRGRVDSTIAGFVAAARDRLALADALFDEITMLIDAGGKRTRPAFCYWGYRSTGAEHGRGIERVAAALELLHTFAIVHDDIMDASAQRRGLPTVHARRGVGPAILVGDMALVLADDLFLSAPFTQDRLHDAFEFYSRMRQEVVAGQFVELDLVGSDEVSEDSARYVARLKSGRYSVREPLLIGAALGGADADLLRVLADFGEALGEAFQLRDDLLGTFGDPREVGKPVDSDVREGKRNVLFAKTTRLLAGRERDFFISHWGAGADLDDDQIERMRSLIERSGALSETENLLEDLAADSRAFLRAAPITDEARLALEDLVDAATTRAR